MQIETLTDCGHWLFYVELDCDEEPCGVRFRHIMQGKRYAVVFDDRACLDWATMTRSAFFTKYAALIPTREQVNQYVRNARDIEGIVNRCRTIEEARSKVGTYIRSMVMRADLCIARGAL